MRVNQLLAAAALSCLAAFCSVGPAQASEDCEDCAPNSVVVRFAPGIVTPPPRS